jgi:hypothetical protein
LLEFELVDAGELDVFTSVASLDEKLPDRQGAD